MWLGLFLFHVQEVRIQMKMLISTLEGQSVFVGLGEVQRAPSHGTLVNGTYTPFPLYFNTYHNSTTNLVGQPLTEEDSCVVDGVTYRLQVEGVTTPFVNISCPSALYVQAGTLFHLPIQFTDPDQDTEEARVYIGDTQSTNMRGFIMQAPLSVLSKYLAENLTLYATQPTDLTLKLYRPPSVYVGEQTVYIYVVPSPLYLLLVFFMSVLGFLCLLGLVGCIRQAIRDDAESKRQRRDTGSTAFSSSSSSPRDNRSTLSVQSEPPLGVFTQ